MRKGERCTKYELPLLIRVRVTCERLKTNGASQSPRLQKRKIYTLFALCIINTLFTLSIIYALFALYSTLLHPSTGGQVFRARYTKYDFIGYPWPS